MSQVFFAILLLPYTHMTSMYEWRALKIMVEGFAGFPVLIPVDKQNFFLNFGFKYITEMLIPHHVSVLSTCHFLIYAI